MIDDLVRKAAAEDDDAIEELIAIADREPGRLIPHQQLLFDLDVLWPPKLFRSADTDLVRRVIERVDGGHTPDSLNHLLLVLAHSGHPLAEAALRRWQAQPPAGSAALHVSALDYALEGGWTVDPDGNRRNVCGDVAYQWILGETSPVADRPGCRWCASPLWTAADLDTTDPAVAAALAHTGWTGRLVIETCHFCSCYATLFCEVSPEGTAGWWSGNTLPSYAPTGGGPEDPPARLPVPGPVREGPFQSSAWGVGGSTLGGYPDWIQDAAHPDCPGCSAPMDYIGLIGGADLDEYGEGAYYLHVHQPCGFAAVNYQQS